MPETTRDPYTGLWTARVERDGRWYIGVGRTEQEAVQAAEDKASKARSSSLTTIQQKIKILESEENLETKILAHVSEGASKDRLKINAAKERLGSIRAELKLLRQVSKDEESIAMAKVAASNENRITNGKALALKITELEYQKLINAEIIRSGAESQKVNLLMAERDRALKEMAAAQHNETPKDRRDKKNAERKLTSDAEKQKRRDAQLDKDILNGVVGTPSSRLEERRRRNIEARNQAKAKGIPAMKTETVLWGLMVKSLVSIQNNTSGNLVITK